MHLCLNVVKIAFRPQPSCDSWFAAAVRKPSACSGYAVNCAWFRYLLTIGMPIHNCSCCIWCSADSNTYLPVYVVLSVDDSILMQHTLLCSWRLAWWFALQYSLSVWCNDHILLHQVFSSCLEGIRRLRKIYKRSLTKINAMTMSCCTKSLHVSAT